MLPPVLFSCCTDQIQGFLWVLNRLNRHVHSGVQQTSPILAATVSLKLLTVEDLAISVGHLRLKQLKSYAVESASIYQLIIKTVEAAG